MLHATFVLCLPLIHQDTESQQDTSAAKQVVQQVEDESDVFAETLFFQAATYSEGLHYGSDDSFYAANFGSESGQRFSIGVDLSSDSDDSSFLSGFLEFGSNSLSNRENRVSFAEDAIVPLTKATRDVKYETFGNMVSLRFSKPNTSSVSLVGGWGWIWVKDKLSLDEELNPGEGTEFSEKWNDFILKYGLKYEHICSDNFSLFVEYRREVLPFGDINWDSEGILLGFKLDL